jgi:hypothetical protein
MILPEIFLFWLFRIRICMPGNPVKLTCPSSLFLALYSGPLLNLAARIKSRAAGGQVLVNADAWEEVKDRGDSVSGLDLGEMDLKGMGGGMHLFQVTKEVRQPGLAEALTITFENDVSTRQPLYSLQSLCRNDKIESFFRYVV